MAKELFWPTLMYYTDALPIQLQCHSKHCQVKHILFGLEYSAIIRQRENLFLKTIYGTICLSQCLNSVAMCWFMVKHHESSMHVFTLMDRRLTFTHKLQFLLMSDLSESHRFLMCWRHRICHSYVMTVFSQLPLSADVIRY